MPDFGKATANTIHIKSSPDGAFLLLLIGLLRAGAPPSVIYKKQVFMSCFPSDHQSIDWWNSYLKKGSPSFLIQKVFISNINLNLNI